MSQEGNRRLRNYKHIAAQVDPAGSVVSPAATRHYLSEYFGRDSTPSLDLFWGSVDDFTAAVFASGASLDERRDRWRRPIGREGEPVCRSAFTAVRRAAPRARAGARPATRRSRGRSSSPPLFTIRRREVVTCWKLGCDRRSKRRGSSSRRRSG